MIRVLPLLLLLLSAAPSTSLAQSSVVIYRCTDASGALSIQNDVPCAKGSEQERRVMETVRPSAPPPPVITPQVPALSAASAAKGKADASAAKHAGDTAHAKQEAGGDSASAAPLDSPPPLFTCRTWERKDHFTDNPVPTRRCAPLLVSGLDGSAGGGSASACEYVVDTCTAVPQEALCAQWRQFKNDTQAMLVFGRAPDPAATRAEVTRIEAILQASSCAGGG